VSVKAVFYKYIEIGGCIDVEDNDHGRCTIAESRTASPTRLRLRATKKLRAMAECLEAEAKSKRMPDGTLEVFPEPRP